MMNTKTLVSVDLDWFNGASNPIRELKNLLRNIPCSTPTIMTIEHHEFLPQLHRWVKSGKVKTPFNLINVDEHHDYYNTPPPYHPEGTENNCGNWGFRLPLEWYNRYTWIRRLGEVGSINDWQDWDNAEMWLDDRNIKHSVRDSHRLSRLNTEFVAAIFCVSPDFLSEDMLNHVTQAIDIIASHFKLARAPKIIRDNVDNNGKLLRESVSSWRVAPRPVDWLHEQSLRTENKTVTHN